MYTDTAFFHFCMYVCMCVHVYIYTIAIVLDANQRGYVDGTGGGAGTGGS